MTNCGALSFRKGSSSKCGRTDNPTIDEKFHIPQRVARGGLTISSVGPVMKFTPFDEFGRRTYTMNTTKGAINVIQGITELTPQYAKVEGLTDYVWDMRIATSTIPREELDKILFKQIDPKNPEDYKRIARFYMQAERYEDAIKVLEGDHGGVSRQYRHEGTDQAGHRFDSPAFGRAVAFGIETSPRRRAARFRLRIC